MTYLDTHVVVWIYAGELDEIERNCGDEANTKTMLLSYRRS